MAQMTVAAIAAVVSTARGRWRRSRGCKTRYRISRTIGSTTAMATAQIASTTPIRKYCVAMNMAIDKLMNSR
ncbi:hypothetical protein D3C83_13480 [compost metagenome]